MIWVEDRELGLAVFLSYQNSPPDAANRTCHQPGGWPPPVTPATSTEGSCSSTGYKGRCVAVSWTCSFVPPLWSRSWENRAPLTPHPITATLWIRRRQAGERTGICRAQDWDVVAKQSIGSVPELLCISIVTAFRAALLMKPANKERWCKDRASDGSVSSCHLCCSFYNAVGSAPWISILL